MRLAIVLYSYHKRVERQQILADVSYRAMRAIPGVEIFVTSRAGHDDGEPDCFRRIPIAVPEGYEFLPDKTLGMLDWITENVQYDYVLKCDDDVLLDPAVIRRLACWTDVPDFVGSTLMDLVNVKSGAHRGRCVTPELNHVDVDTSWTGGMIRIAVGTCYGLSRRAVEVMRAKRTELGFCPAEARSRFDIRGVAAEDWVVAWLARECNIYPTRAVRMINAGCGRQLASGVLSEILVRTRLRSAKGPCLGVYLHNRMPRRLEAAAIRSWFRLSSCLPEGPSGIA